MIDVRNMNELLKYKQSLEEQLGHNKTNNNKMQKAISWGDIYYAELDGQGSEQSGYRPVIIIQNNVGNRFSPTVVIATITSKLGKANVPTHVTIEGYGLKSKSVIEAEQIKTIDKNRLKSYIGRVDDYVTINKIKKAIEISTAQDISPLDRIKDEDIREIIEDKLDSIRTYERIITEGRNQDFINDCLHRRKSELSDLEDFCLENNLNYRIFYKKYEPKVKNKVRAV